MKKNMNKVTGICLGVIDMKKSLQFYRDKLGFKTDETGDNPDVVFFCPPAPNWNYTRWICWQRTLTRAILRPPVPASEG